MRGGGRGSERVGARRGAAAGRGGERVERKKDTGDNSTGMDQKKISTATGESATTTEASNTQGTVNLPLSTVPPELSRCSAKGFTHPHPLIHLCTQASTCAKCLSCRWCVQMRDVFSDHLMPVAYRLPNCVGIEIRYARGAMMKLVQLLHSQWIVRLLRC